MFGGKGSKKGGGWRNSSAPQGGQSEYGGYGGNAENLFVQNQTGINFEEAHKQPVEVSPKDPRCPPLGGWDSAQIDQSILRNIQRCGYKSPTPIQKHGIPIAAFGKDLVACAQTGSGKTAAFLLPTINTLISQRFNASGGGASRIGALVLAPSRELATQIFQEAQKFCFQTDVRPAVVYGGSDFRPQIDALSAGVELLVATPGRLVDHHEKGRVVLSQLKVFVMDEADRMLDMGFEPQIRQIVKSSGMPSRRQTMMFSATFPPMVQRLAQDFVGREYTFMTVGIVGSTHEYIKQSLVWVEDIDKRLYLLGILMGDPGMTLVFCNTKQETNMLCRFVSQQGFTADCIHGDRTQAERENALRKFKEGHTQILVATDVAARGLDIQGVALVVQYDMPTDVDDCVY